MLKNPVIILLMLFSGPVLAQKLLVESKQDLTIAYGWIKPLGPSIINEKSFEFPSLFNNMNYGFNINLNYTRKLKDIIWAGIDLDHLRLSNWEIPGSLDVYNEAIVSKNSVHIGILFKSTFRETGIRNKFTVYSGFKTGINQVIANLPASMNELINPDSEIIEQTFHSVIYSPGFMVNAGAGYALNNKFGITISFDIQYIPLHSTIYPDRKLMLFKANAGLFLRLDRDKYYLLR